MVGKGPQLSPLNPIHTYIHIYTHGKPSYKQFSDKSAELMKEQKTALSICLYAAPS